MPKTPPNQDKCHVFHFAYPSFYFPTTIPYCNVVSLINIHSNLFVYKEVYTLFAERWRYTSASFNWTLVWLANHYYYSCGYHVSSTIQYKSQQKPVDFLLKWLILCFVYLYVTHCLYFVSYDFKIKDNSMNKPPQPTIEIGVMNVFRWVHQVYGFIYFVYKQVKQMTF